MKDRLHYAIRGNEILIAAETNLLSGAAPKDWDCLALPADFQELAEARMKIAHQKQQDQPETAVTVFGYPAETLPPVGYRWLPLREAVNSIAEQAWLPAARAMAYINWHKNNRYCGRCGSVNQELPGESGLKCCSCGNLNFPRLSPAVLAVVVKDGKLLLARNTANTQGFWSLIAGFVEPGERLEDCVEREVLEEVGINVKATGYLGSQPWPFPDQLMLGFSARWLDGDLQPDGKEIAEAGWFAPDTLPPIPRSGSLSRRLIDQACAQIRSG